LLDLCERIVRHTPASYPVGRGLPIGNLTSQYFANLYLNQCDHWIKQQARVPAYLRYVDDFIFLSNSKDQLHDVKSALADQFREIGLTIHPAKQQIMRSSERIDILGYKVSPDRRWLRNDNGFRFSRKLKRMTNDFNLSRLDWSDLHPRLYSWIGHAKHAETHGLRKALFANTYFSRADV
jgi:RNA-directed DNA polymerase